MLYRVSAEQLSECERDRYEHNLDEMVNVCDFVYHRQLNVLDKCKYISLSARLSVHTLFIITNIFLFVIRRLYVSIGLHIHIHIRPLTFLLCFHCLCLQRRAERTSWTSVNLMHMRAKIISYVGNFAVRKHR